MEEKINSVLITGASSGIGKALVEVFANNAYHVIGISRREKNLIDLKKSLGENEKYFDYLVADISERNQIEEICDNISSKYFVHCLINNAGISSFKSAIDDTIDEIEKIIKTNLFAPIYLIKKFLPEMILKKDGTIINILSVVNKKIFTNSSIYSASKTGLESFSKVLREEHRNDNIKIINVFPGAIATEIWPSKALEKYSSKMMDSKSVANIIFQAFEQKGNLSVEELVIRPITGDL
ncbi:MAG: SDR family NAD(P)-dependent oxidoreductase [Stygiobacter sp.]|jgi:short-subunit dehydrogenase